MASCERCYAMSRGAQDPYEEYRRLLLVNDCTPEQQAGPMASWCAKCEAWTGHQHLHECIACGEKTNPKPREGADV